MVLYLILAGLLALRAPLALRKGRERAGFVIVAAAALALILAQARGASVWVLFAFDLLSVLLLGRLSWKAPRSWPLWVMTALGVGAAASLAYMLQPDVSEQTYARAMLLTRYAAALALLLGTRAKQASHS